MPKVAAEYLEAKRADILDAAITCFSRNGFQRTTVQDIVTEAGLSAGAIYRYFSSKEDIVRAIAEEHRSPPPELLGDATAERPVAEIFRELLTATFNRLTDPDEQRWRRITVQLWSEALRDERVMVIVRAGRDEPIEQIADVIRRGQNEGVIDQTLDPLAAARVCASLFYGLVLQQASDPSVDVERYVDVVRSLMETLFAARS